MTDHPADISLPLSDDPPAPEGSRFGKAHHILLAFCALAAISWILSGFYTVNTDELAIVERLGSYVSTPEGKPVLVERGLHYHIPWPIDRVEKVPIQRATTFEIKTFNESPDAYADFKRSLKEIYDADTQSAIFDPYLITGDKNIVHVQIAVTCRIDDPVEWLSTVSFDPNQNLALEGDREFFIRRLIEHAMISGVATVDIDHILAQGSADLPPLLSRGISENFELNDPTDPTGKHRISLGLRVDKVDVTKVAPPANIKPAFDLVAQSRGTRDSLRLNATALAESAKVKAGADAFNMKQQADAYKSATINTAKGEAARFSQIYAQYKIAPDITQYTVYYDAVKAIQTAATRTVFAQPGQHIWITIDPPAFDPTQQPQNAPR